MHLLLPTTGKHFETKLVLNNILNKHFHFYWITFFSRQYLYIEINFLNMAEPDTFEEENPLSPGSLALILSNLFRREDGEPMDFYIRKIRFQDRSDKVQLKEKLEKLNEEIDVSTGILDYNSASKHYRCCLYLQRCGGKLEKEPISNHAVELAFPEVFDDERNIDSDIFDAEYIFTCVKSLEILELEPFR